MVEFDENDFIACDKIDTIFRGKFESADTMIIQNQGNY